jgi:hypothetical protein
VDYVADIVVSYGYAGLFIADADPDEGCVDRPLLGNPLPTPRGE